MKTLLSFLGGASLVFVAGMIGLSQQSPSPSSIIALGWFGGIIVGAWSVGFVMFLFAQTVGTEMAKRFTAYTYYVPPPVRRVPQPQSPPIFHNEEDIPTAEVVEEDENEMNIYEDPDWWKDEKKRQQHRRRNENG